MGFLVILSFGLAVAANLAVIKWKLEHYKYTDAAVDAAVLVTLTYVFSGSIAGLAVSTVASAFISMYLLVSPPDILMNRAFDDKKKKKKNKKKSKRKSTTTSIH